MIPRVLGLAGWSGSGKTTLAVQLIAGLKAKGLKISTLKHGHHRFDVDHPGKDSHRHRQAGAAQVLISSVNRWALMTELDEGQDELKFEEALAQLAPCDLVLVEGFKRASFPKLEVYRPSVGKPLLLGTVPGICALATDAPQDRALLNLPDSLAVPVLDLNNLTAVLTWVEAFCRATD